ncbi:MAG: TRAP transporter substrate-binding protein [Pseudomonadota bacterium]
MISRRKLAAMASGAALSLAVSTSAFAQEVTLKLHQFLPAQANVPKLILDVWADNVQEASKGRIKIDRYPSMQLGGTPPELIDQVTDGIADVVWTVVGYTPGRFPSTEVLELPFIISDTRAASYAYWKLFEKHMRDADFKDMHVLGTWVHGQGVIHSNREIKSPADMRGVKLRGATRQINAMIEELGAEPIGMPVPAVTEALSKGVIDGATLPWEVTTGLRVPELVQHHTEFDGPHLYNLTFVLAMNKDRYEGLPDDLKAVIDENSGLEFSVFAGGTQADSDAEARQFAVDLGNEIVTIPNSEIEAWRDKAAPVYDNWIAEVAEKGIDGQALIDDARAFMEEYASTR